MSILMDRMIVIAALMIIGSMAFTQILMGSTVGALTRSRSTRV
ncbi:MAG TPA: hypothetical protein VHN11_12060 [Xanthobacteraceae bacterium]|nr:hypothetical protein [Xanthobacteraceae bacterium]